MDKNEAKKRIDKLIKQIDELRYRYHVLNDPRVSDEIYDSLEQELFELEKQFTCRYEHLHFDTGTQLMDGATALKFIRSRHSDQHGGDFARGVRQQAVLTAVRNKLISLDALTNIDDFFAEFSQLIVSDITEKDIIEFLSQAGDPSEYTSSNINISTDNYLQNSVSSDGQYILNPKAGAGNWEAVHTFIKRGLH